MISERHNAHEPAEANAVCYLVMFAGRHSIDLVYLSDTCERIQVGREAYSQTSRSGADGYNCTCCISFKNTTKVKNALLACMYARVSVCKDLKECEDADFLIRNKKKKQKC